MKQCKVTARIEGRSLNNKLVVVQGASSKHLSIFKYDGQFIVFHTATYEYLTWSHELYKVKQFVKLAEQYPVWDTEDMITVLCQIKLIKALRKQAQTFSAGRV